MDKNGKGVLNLSAFVVKVAKAVAIFISMLLLTALFLKGFKVLLLILAGVLIAIFFRGIASYLTRFLPINNGVALGVSVVLTAALLVGVGFILSPSISEQISELKSQIPSAISRAESELKETHSGQFVLDQINQLGLETGGIQKRAYNFFNSVFGVLGDVYLIFFLGMFFMAEPKIYRKGMTSLIPIKYRPRADKILFTIGYTLKRWLLGKMLSMFVVFIFTVIGLYALGIPIALTLSLFAGIISFIPNFGPLMALVPALLIASLQGFNYVVYVLILYVAIQAIESNLITPVIQKRMISFPMAMILIAQVVLGIFTGYLGLVLATPIVAIIMVMVKMIYVQGILGDTEVHVLGEDLYEDEDMRLSGAINNDFAESESEA